MIEQDQLVPDRPTGSTAIALALLTTLVLASCDSEQPFASGNFEADEVTVSSEVGGQLIWLDAIEGAQMVAGTVVGLVDTTQIALQLVELEAQSSAARAQTERAGSEVAALEAEQRGAELDLARVRRLFDAEAATLRQLEQATSRVEVLAARIRAARQSTEGVQQQSGATEARVALLRDQLERSNIRNPVTGTVLTTYAKAGEFVQPGRPLYTIADLGTLELRAYLTGSQLGQVRIGQEVLVEFDVADGERSTRSGVVSWVASEAEFTPTPIQTRDERADLVYAVTVRVPNADGMLKIGMPGDIVVEAADAENATTNG